jgi:hypothetical protein
MTELCRGKTTKRPVRGALCGRPGPAPRELIHGRFEILSSVRLCYGALVFFHVCRGVAGVKSGSFKFRAR